MMEKFPHTNRTGCGALYLAQYAVGEEQERRLREVIEKYSDCWYGDGAQVGPLARLLLGQIYWQSDRKDQARLLFDQINRDFPGSITHRGILISERIKQLQGDSPATQPGSGGS